jgi:hypothetical protein
MDSVSPKKKKVESQKKKKIFFERGSFQSGKSSKKGVSALVSSLAKKSHQMACRREDKSASRF